MSLCDKIVYLLHRNNIMNQINEIGKQLGMSLMKTGSDILRASLKLTPTEVPAWKIENFLKLETKNANITLSDGKYKLIPFDQWLKIFKILEHFKEKYIVNYHDCDNLAYWFSAETARLFHINSGGVIHGHCYNKDGSWAFGHFWNIPVVKLPVGFKIYFYDLMTGLYIPYEKGQNIMGKWKYEELTFRFF